MQFANDQLLIFAWVLLLLLGVLIFRWRKQQRLLQQVAKIDMQPIILPHYSAGRQRLQLIAAFITATLLFIALLRPQWGFRWVVQHSRGSDLIFVVDTSDSMRAADLQPNRLERARRKIIDMLGLLRGERIGLVAFAGDSHLLCPLTLDYSAFTIFLDYLDTQLIPTQGTDLGAAVATAVQGFDKQSRAQRNILLITDGEDHEEAIDKAIETAKAMQVKIFVVGIGSSEGAPIPAERGGGFRKDEAGNVILSRLNEPLLEKLAKATGGQYVRSMAGDLDLETLYANGIRGGNANDSGQQQEDRKQEFTERYQFFLAPALLLMLLPYFLGNRRRILSAGVLFILISSGLGTSAQAGPISRGVKSYNKEQYDAAQEQFTQGQVDHPDDPTVHYNLGNSLYRLKRYDEAAKEFEKAVNNGAGKWPKKLPAEKKQIERDAQFNYGNSLFQQQKYEEAIKRYESALAIDAKDADATYNLELAKKLLEQQKQQQQQQKQDDAKSSQNKAQNQQQNQENNPNKDDKQAEQQQQKEEPSAPDKPEQNDKNKSAGANEAKDVKRDEAKMWLSGIEENGKENLQQTLKKLHGKKRTPDKDW